jgi:uncharacterized membrane protein YjgN (DUF898 family)
MPPAADSGIATTAATASRISWVQPPTGFVRLSLINGLLRIITLGVYHFWGKTEVRQRIWSAVRIDGEPLEYRGTGGELFRGFLIVFALILVPLLIGAFVMLLLFGHRPGGRGAYEIVGWALFFVLSGFGIHRARRYRLSRTYWRGIRGGLSGRAAPFAWTYVWTTVLIPFTLGWIVPWRAVRLQRTLVNETRFGDKPFTFTARAGPLYARYWLVWLSAIVLFIGTIGVIGAVVGVDMQQAVPRPRPVSGARGAGIVAIILGALLIFAMIRAWYSTRMFNYFAAETRYQGAGFTLRATVPSLVWLVASNFLIRISTLGFLSPVAEARATRYMVDRLALDGGIAWQQVAQNPDALLQSGEGLAEAFNVDAY